MAAITRTVRNVALPVEHGGWAFLLEPILLGLLIVPSPTSVFLGISGIGLFLLYQPTQIALKDRLKHKRYPRTDWAERFVLIYGAIALLGGALALLTARSSCWIALVLAIPFALLQMGLVLRGYGHSATAEISGAVALAALTPALLLANGLALDVALGLWLVPVVRAFSSITYIRARLRRSRGEKLDWGIPLVAQCAGLAILGLAWLVNLLPVTAFIAMIILAARAVYGLIWSRTDVPTKNIGFQEIAFGVLMVLLTIIGR